MARAPSRRFGFVKLPGKAKRWRNESNPDFPIGAEISDRAMSGLSRSLRFAGQTVSKERYAKGVKSGAFSYHPKTIQRLELLEFRRAVIDQYAPQMRPRERQLIYEWMRQRKSGVMHPRITLETAIPGHPIKLKKWWGPGAIAQAALKDYLGKDARAKLGDIKTPLASQ